MKLESSISVFNSSIDGPFLFFVSSKNYLNAHAYGNAKTEDLWRYLAEVRHEISSFYPITFHVKFYCQE